METHVWTNSSSGAGDHSGGGTAATVLHSHLSGATTTFHHAGKRHYYDVTVDNHAPAVTKRGRPPYPYYVTGATTAAWPASPPQAVVPRCQVEGCHVALGNVKDYYKKHKVCEIHSKAPKVVVLGRQQRFCQQCSRFHGVAEFDEDKRSCRRRLKGHNQRRRKGSLPNTHNMTVRRLGPPSPSPSPSPGCALSFLSSPATDHWNSSGDFSSRSGATVVYELMAANRATSVLGHLLNQSNCDESVASDYTLADAQMWDRLGYTVDLKQAAALEFGVLSAKEKSRDPEEWTDCCWSSFGGANVV